ncbi:MAG: enoyl-CoA hydratase/isomerase family protein [Gammaproteobacteria bacterium]|nr:MAG: enoyl-CoA hydratase/isomerase family protein [Gammaproteobacteria bacterium]
MSDKIVISSIEGNVGLIIINRADKFNCLSMAVHQALQDALQAHESNSEVRAVLLCSEGDHFCTGADLDEVHGKIAAKDDAVLREFIELGHKTCRDFEQTSLPVVGAIQGFCLAGGLEISLGCDLLFAADDALFGDQHANYGLIPGWGGSQRLTRIIGFRRALDLMLSGRRLKAKEAQEWGMVNYLAPAESLREEALKYCHLLASKSSGGLSMMKALAYQGSDLSLDDALRLEVNEAIKGLQSEDVGEGLAAFGERREPVFRSR